MVFIRKIKRGKHTYLAEVENKWINGKVVQKHIRYVGHELNGKPILSGSLVNAEVTKVTTWAPLLVLDTIAKQIHLSYTLGDYGEYLLSMAYAHCLDPKSVNKMEDWYRRTDLHKILDIADVSEKKLYNAMDSINEKNSEHIQRRIFRSVQNIYNLRPKGFFFDVTNVYFYGTECKIAKKGYNKEGGNKPQVQIGLAVTEDEGIPIFHRTFEGNIFDARVLNDIMTAFHEFNIKDAFLVWDKGVSSEVNIVDAKRTGFDIICGLAIKQKLKNKVDGLIDKKKFIQLKNRIRLQNTVIYCIKQKYTYGKISGNIVLCFNEETARINRERRIDNVNRAKELMDKKKSIPFGVQKYFRGEKINESALLSAQKYDGYTVLFSTKDLPIEKIVKPYFEKDKVEKAFRSLKSVLGLRPIKHWLEERVKSHIFICYLAYLLITLLEYKLRKTDFTALSALDKLESAYKVYLRDPKTKNEFEKNVMLTTDQEKIMKAVDKKILKS
jgi:transposase